MRKDFEAWVRRIAPAGGDINWDGQPIKVSWATWQAATTAAQQPAAVVKLTDADILNVMRDGYGCRENDWQDHINFARAIIARKGGAD